LTDPRYCNDFNYISTVNPNRNTLIVDDDSVEDNYCDHSDLGKTLLNLGFLSDEIIKGLQVIKDRGWNHLDAEQEEKEKKTSTSASRLEASCWLRE
jgi:hypothetical protein